ncbi:unnamed protein product [Umbelopsis vinacea]
MDHYSCPNPIPATLNADLTPSLPTSWDIPAPAGHLRCYDCEKFMPARYANGQPSLIQALFAAELIATCIGAVNSQNAAILESYRIFELSASESNFSSLECLNDVERQYLRQYLAASEMTLEEMWAKSMRMLDNGDYICSAASDLTTAAQDHCDAYRQPLTNLSDTPTLLSSTSNVSSLRPSSVLLACASCKIDVFWGQVFGFSKSIPRSGMPVA